METVINSNAAMIKVKSGKNPKQLYLHQSEVIKKLNNKINESNKFGGLLVITTGDGKTITAVQWVLRNIIDENKKVLWVAYRHELLNQVVQAVINNSYSDIMRNRKQFSFSIYYWTYRLVMYAWCRFMANDSWLKKDRTRDASSKYMVIQWSL